jgi:hypothetical protein
MRNRSQNHQLLGRWAVAGQFTAIEWGTLYQDLDNFGIILDADK